MSKPITKDEIQMHKERSLAKLNALLDQYITSGKDEYLKNIIVADLKSTDKTKEIVKKLSEEYQTIKPLSWKECKDIMDNIDDT